MINASIVSEIADLGSQGQVFNLNSHFPPTRSNP